MKDRILAAVEYGKGMKKQYDDCHIATCSAQAAFFILLSAVPLLMFIVILLGALAPFDVIGVQQMMMEIFTENISGQLAEFVAEIKGQSTVPLASVTMVFLIWAATKGIRSLSAGIDAIYAYGEEYNFIQLAVRSVGYAFAMIVVFIVAFGILVLAAPLEALLRSFLGQWADIILGLINAGNVIFYAALTVLFATAYKSLAKSTLSFKQQLPGAAFAAAGWIIYSFGYSIYIRHFSSYSALYGSFGAVMLFMLWLYMCMNILLCGALFNKLLAEKRKKSDCD